MSRKATDLHGLLVIDKPAGLTSHDVVSRVRRMVGQKQVGHAGTLDPAATGVLVVATGFATRLLPFIVDASKSYRAEITLGVQTDTYDADGSVVGVSAVPELHVNDMESVLDTFRGTFSQQVPAYSAVQRDGQRFYDLARAGVEIDLPSRIVTISQIELVQWNAPVLTVDVECSKGTYIRSLANDIGRAVGCGAHLSLLCRTRVGRFDLAEAWSLADLKLIDLRSQWQVVAYHPDAAIEESPVVILSGESSQSWLHGRTIPTQSIDEAETVRVYSPDGWFVGVGEVTQSEPSMLVHPHRVVYPPTDRVEDQPAQQ